MGREGGWDYVMGFPRQVGGVEGKESQHPRIRHRRMEDATHGIDGEDFHGYSEIHERRHLLSRRTSKDDHEFVN